MKRVQGMLNAVQRLEKIVSGNEGLQTHLISKVCSQAMQGPRRAANLLDATGHDVAHALTALVTRLLRELVGERHESSDNLLLREKLCRTRDGGLRLGGRKIGIQSFVA